MKFGLFSNSSRFNPNPWENYQSDLDEIIAADRAGFEEVWISEHLGAPLPGFVTVPELLIAKAAGLTDNVRLGSGVRLLPLFHPLEVANQAGFNDHLTRGRYNFGAGTGFPGVHNSERRGIPGEDRIPRAVESLEFIRRCWESPEPFDFDGEYFSGRDVFVEPRPYQSPHPPISLAAGEAMTELAGSRGYSLLLGHWDTPRQLAPKVEEFLAAAHAAGIPDPRALIKICRIVYVAEDTKTAREESREGFARELQWRKGITPHLFKAYPVGDETVDDLTVDMLQERGAFFVGSPDKVAAQLNEFAEETGGFGSVLLIGGKDVSTSAGRQRSYELFANYVAPQLVDHNLAVPQARAS